MQPTAQALGSLRLRTTSNGRLDPSLRFDRSGRQQVAERRPTNSPAFPTPGMRNGKDPRPGGAPDPHACPKWKDKRKTKIPTSANTGQKWGTRAPDHLLGRNLLSP
jgi:hypothetical protein